MSGGHFHYFGLETGILNIFKKYRDKNPIYSLDFNIDGLPIHKSTAESFWPILCRVVEHFNEPPFAVAIYSGSTKPPLSDFFSEFIGDGLTVFHEGLQFENKIITVSYRSFCGDTPARNFVKKH